MARDLRLEEEKLDNLDALSHLRRLVSYLGPLRTLLAVCVAVSLMSSGIRVLLPQLVRYGVDQVMLGQGLAEQRLDFLWQLCGLFVLLLMVGLVADFCVPLGLNRVGQEVIKRVRSEIWEKLHRLPISYFDRNAVGRLVTRVTNDTNALAEMFTSVVSTGLAEIFMFACILLVMAWQNLELTAVLLLLAPPLILLALWFRRVSQEVHRELRVLLARLNAFLQESAQGVAVIKSFTAEKEVRRRFGELADAFYHKEIELVHRVAVFRPTIAVASIVATALLLGYGGRQILEGRLSVGEMVAFLFYLRMLFAPLTEMAERFNIFQRAVVASERLFRIMDEEPEPGGGGHAEPVQGRVQFQEVHFAYDPDKPVLRGVSFEIEQGETVALVGPTGSGKTTVASLLLGLYPLKGKGSGSILLDGVPLEEWEIDHLRRNVGLVQQDLFLFSGDVRRNVTLFEDIPEEKVQRALSTARADQIVEGLSGGLDHELGQGSELSQGERQLLSFARALAADTPVLVLDEATASIDSKTEALITEALEALLKGRTALIIAHRLSTIQKADKIVVLSEGRVVEVGTHQQLLAREGLYTRLYLSQQLRESLD